jgi:uncharacterized protein YdeI (YjbR/CyaY-like superfamily)
MRGHERPPDEFETPDDLAEALQARPDAEAIWDRLPKAHRRGHVIAIQRIVDPEARAQKIQHTVEHLLEKHGP